MPDRGIVDLGGWKYQLVRDVKELVALTDWLRHNATSAEPVSIGLGVGDSILAFASRETGWVIDLRDFENLEPVHMALKGALIFEKGKSYLITRCALSDIPKLRILLGGKLTEEEDRALVHVLDQDIDTIVNTTGQPLPQATTDSYGAEMVVKLALDSVTTGIQEASAAPDYYRKVAMPYLKHSLSHTWDEGKDPAQFRRWTVTFERVLWRVIAHYTRDPLLVRWFLDGKDPMHEFQALTNLAEDQACAFLMWLICGQDADLLASAYPRLSPLLPAAPITLRSTTLDQPMASMIAGFSQILEEIKTTPQTKTLFGNRSLYGIRPTAGLEFVLAGSVGDIQEIAVVTLCNLDSRYHWTTADCALYNGGVDRITIVGLSPSAMNPSEWRQLLEQCMTLGNPLHGTFQSIDLDPKVTCE